MYRNSERYSDPTVGAALSNLGREEAQKRKAWNRKRVMVTSRPKVYVISPYAGDTANNIRQARRYCRFIAGQKKIPVASHLLYPQFLNDKNLVERELGLLFGLALLRSCAEVWCFGTKLSSGMKLELEEAKRQKKAVRFFNENIEEIK